VTLRRRLLLAVLTVVAVAVAGLIAAFNVLLASTLDRDAHDLVRSRALAQLEAVRVVNGGIRVSESPDDVAPDTAVWIFSHGRLLEAPRSGEHVSDAARALASDDSRFRTVESADTLLYALPIIADRRRVGTIVAGTSFGPYEKTRRIALLGSVVFGAFALLLVALGARWLLASALRPVQRMTRQAADWGERDLDRRFGLGPPRDELTELAATLDGLLEHLAASLRREQRFSAELSHELRTPLARLLGESELALRRERQPAEYRAALELINQNAQQLTRIVDALVAAARLEASQERVSADAYAVARDAAAACHDPRLEVELVEPAHPLRVGVDADFAARILQPVLDNACRYGAHAVTVSIAREDGSIRYAVEDDGPGVVEEERERIFEPGVRGAAAGGTRGSGLGLSLARRLARSVAGDVEADGGARFVVRLPAA
jgi:signal transduction histidine kinase